MSQPPDHYERSFDFTDFSAMQPDAQQPGQKIDQELNAARESLNDTIDRLGEIQRDDGKIRSSALDTTEFTGIVNAATATATAAAASATASAATATTKASDAEAAASAASGSETLAAGFAASAMEQADIASTAATTATTKATEAAGSASAASTSAVIAADSASTANTKAGEASTSASNAATSASDAASSASTATAQATSATASASAASGSASTASSQATIAQSAATAASASASAAASSATAAAASAASVVGMPAGGSTGQVATKQSGADYDIIWSTPTGGTTSPADSLTTDQVDAVATAQWKDWGSPAATAYTVPGVGSLGFFDSAVASDGRTITFYDDSAFSVISGAPNYVIAVPTSYGGASTTTYMEDLVSFLSTAGLTLTASWFGASTTSAVDLLPPATSTFPFTLAKPAVAISAGERLMIESGLKRYLAGDALTYSAASGSALIYGLNNPGVMDWGKPWETWAYSKTTTDGLLSGYAKLSGTNTYGAGTQKLPASAAGYAPLNIAHGVAPVSPTNGDIWTTTGGLFYQINGATVSPATLAGGTYTGKITTLASSSTSAGFNLPHGAAPSAPVNGDMWTTTGGISLRLNGNNAVIFNNRGHVNPAAGFQIQAQAATSSLAGLTLGSGTTPTSPAAGDIWITSTQLQYCSSAGTSRTVVALQTTNTHTSGAKNTFLHNASLAGLNVGPATGDPSTPADGDIWFNSTTNTLGFRSTRNFSLNACRAFVNFNGTGNATWPGNSSTVSRTAGTTTATVTTSTAHGLATGNTIYALTGVVAGIYTVTVVSSTSFTFTTVETTALTSASITFAVNTMRSNMNVSSITDNGVGDYTVNFATALPDANYVPVITVSGYATTNCAITGVVYGSTAGASVKTTTALRIQTGSSNTGSPIDMAEVNVAIFR